MRVAVVGAGPAGCTAAYRLRADGHDVVLIEAADHVGGRTATWRENGLTIDTGAFYVCNLYRATLSLLRELGRERELVPMERVSTLVDGDARWEWRMGSPSAVLRARGVSPLARAKAMLKMAVHAARSPDPFSIDELAARDTGETVAGWARRSVGHSVHEGIVRPSFEPYWLFRTEQAVASLFTSFARDAPRLRLLAMPEGTDSLCRWLAEGVPLRLATAVREVRGGQRSAVVTLEAGETFEADAAVVATDAHAAARLLPAHAAPLQTVAYAHSVHLSLIFDENPWVDRRATTHPARPGEHDVATVSLLSHKVASWVPPGCEVVDVYLGAWGADRLDPAQQLEAALDAVRSWLGAPASPPARTLTFDRPNGVMIPAPGHYDTVRAVRDALPPTIALAGDYHSAGIIEGAVRSGLDAAAAVAAAESASR